MMSDTILGLLKAGGATLPWIDQPRYEGLYAILMGNHEDLYGRGVYAKVTFRGWDDPGGPIGFIAEVFLPSTEPGVPMKGSDGAPVRICREQRKTFDTVDDMEKWVREGLSETYDDLAHILGAGE